ncbi:MAG: dipeptidase PepE [Streptosporangiaceae bacterium]|jgi:dipeptidase E
MTPIELLLLSNSTGYGGTFLGHALDAVAETLGGRRHLLFVPYALADQGGYTARVRAALEPAGITVTGLDEATAPLAEVQRAEALFIGGGNSFRLLAELQRLDLVEAIRQRVLTGMPYLGASAGTNMACPSLRTSNDMPIVEPRSFQALRLVPFQINPHYIDPDPSSRHMGETRQARIAEFLEENDVPVLGLREGSWLRISGSTATIGGLAGGRLFTRNAEPRDLPARADVSLLLGVHPHFDTRA